MVRSHIYRSPRGALSHLHAIPFTGFCSISVSFLAWLAACPLSLQLWGSLFPGESVTLSSPFLSHFERTLIPVLTTTVQLLFVFVSLIRITSLHGTKLYPTEVCRGGCVWGKARGEWRGRTNLGVSPVSFTPSANPSGYTSARQPGCGHLPLRGLPQASPHCFTCLLPLLLPSYHPRSSQLPEGKGTFYHIPALLTALQGLPHHLPNKI